MSPLPRFAFNLRLGGSETCSGCSGEERNLFRLPGFEVRFLGHPSRGLVTVVTELLRTVRTCIYLSLEQLSSRVLPAPYYITPVSFQHFVAWYLSLMLL